MTGVPKPNHKRRKPKSKERNRIKPEEYDKALEYWGGSCFCQNPFVEMHHVYFRSKGGRGTWRNLHPLCPTHHRNAHEDDGFRRHLEVMHKRKFGNHYWMDEHDLYENGLIEEPTKSNMEYYFNTQEEL
ncbi:HNH endonuclease [Virgibacillus siamensis]|uniref:HNH endonuclease n=1 Tax=Virgibacillus siamensis TaxID=480071 RepID=UPI000985713C|nr:HNH endonuclease signature motif containing protein [Virgibacillus siamensis]